MKTRIVCLLGLSALFLPLTVSAAPAVNFPVLEQLRIPPYPYLARIAETEGTVGVDVSLDSKCGITGEKVGTGDPRLVEAVMRSLYEGSDPLRFHPCTISQAAVVHISYIFSLQGQATNRWSPTEVRVTTDRGRFFDIRITTAPPDLEALGLRRINQRIKAGDHRNPQANNYHSSDDLDVMASQAREGATGGSVQTIFTSPSYAFRDANIRGDVRVEVDLDSECRVSKAKTLSGSALLSEEVLRAVREWQFPECPSETRTMELVFHFLLTEPDSPSPYGNWAPTHFEMVGPYEFTIRTVGPDPIIYDEFRIP